MGMRRFFREKLLTIYRYINILVKERTYVTDEEECLMVAIDAEARKFLAEKLEDNLAVRVFFGGYG